MANPEERLGGGPNGATDIMNHPWFAGVDWNMILKKQIKPPFKPRLTSEADIRYIDESFTAQELMDSPESMAGSLKGGNWAGFTYQGNDPFL